jgi:Ribosomal silencing factor during starvation
MLKEARAKAGIKRPVRLVHDKATPWIAVNCGATSVHCMSAAVREELDLEEFAATPGDIVWWRQAEQRLTLHNIGAQHTDAQAAWDAASAL